MRKTIITLTVLMSSLISMGQNAPVKDTIPDDSVAIINKIQIIRVMDAMKKNMTIDQAPLYEFLFQQIQAIYTEGVINWRRKNGLEKKK